MNNLAMQGVWKMVKNMVPPEKMKDFARQFLDGIIEAESNFELDETANEKQVIASFYSEDGEAMFSLMVFNDQKQIVRQENVQTVDQLIDKILSLL